MKPNITEILINNIDAIVNMRDIETDKVIYINKKGIELFGNTNDKKCWEYLHNNISEQCSFCPKKYIIEYAKLDRPYIWEIYNNNLNKWYEHHSKVIDYESKKVILEISYDITDRKKDEKKILSFLNYQNIISHVAESFTNIKNFKDKVNDIINFIGNNLNAKRIIIREISKDERYASVSYQWKHRDMKSMLTALEEIDIHKDSFPLQELKDKGRIKSKDIKTDFHENYAEILSQFGIESVLIIPIKIDNILHGYISVQDSTKRDWTAAEIKLMKTIAVIFSNAYIRKLSQEKLVESEQNLRKANISKDKFFSIIAHDLKNPIFSVINLSDYLLKNLYKWEIPKIQQFVSYINKAANQNYELLENLLIWARTQSKSITIESTNFDIYKEIHANQQLLNNLLLNKQIKFSIEKENKKTIVFADKNMISTVIRNLLSNAIKFTDQRGEIKVLIKDYNSEKQQYKQITIQDTGVGIEEKNIPKLFKIDENYSTHGTEEETGSGLGLLICKEFIEANKGEIKVESKVNTGSKFIFTIPTEKN